jgi:hypothetical protein
MASNELKVILTGDATKLSASLNAAEKKLKSFGDSATKIGKSMSLFVTTPIILAGGAAIKMASDFQESLNKVDVAFKGSSNEVRDFAKTTLESFGIAEGTALDMAALFGDMATSMGASTSEASQLSTSLVGLAGDLASFKNMNIEEVTTALNGVFTGETESLKRLGIVMTEANLAQFALEQGNLKNIKSFTQAEKVQLRYAFVMAKSENAIGDFARTSDGAANQMRVFQESIKELGALFGEVILPLFTKVVTKLNSILKGFKNLSPEGKKTIVVIAGIAAAIGPLLIVIGLMAKGLAGLRVAIVSVNTALLANPFIAAAAAVTALGVAFLVAANKIAPSLSTWEQIKTSLSGIAAPLSIAGRLAIAESKKIVDAAATANAAASAIGQKGGNGLDYKTILMPNAPEKSKSAATVITPRLEIENVEVINGEEAQRKRDELFKGLFKGKLGKIDTTSLKQSTTDALVSLGEGLKPIAENAVNVGLDIGPAIADGIGFLAEGIASGTMTLGQVFGSMLGMIADMVVQLGKSAIKIGVGMISIKAAFKNPLTAIAAGVALVVLGSVIKNKISQTTSGGGVSAFADGGIVSGPTMGLVGEYPGARSNPEVIAPLDKLKNIIGTNGGNSNVNVTGEFRINGQDLVVLLQKAEKTRSRIK